MIPISYKVNNAAEQDILQHLIRCDETFVPRLSERVELQAYAAKLFDNAVKFEAWTEHALSGLIAAYFNPVTSIGFITNVSVEKHLAGGGIASKLLQNCIEYATVSGYKTIQLEVQAGNEAAIGLYKKFHFTEAGRNDDQLTMVHKIKVNQTINN